MTATPIDLAARRREARSCATRKDRSPEAERALSNLLAFRSRWIEVITFDGRFTDTEQRIGSGAVSRYLNRDPENARFGMFWMSVARLAGDLDVGERTVTRALQKLRVVGYSMLVEPGGGKRKATVYRPTLPGMASDTLPPAAPYGSDTLPPAAPYGPDTLPPAAPYGLDTLPPAAPYGLDTLPPAAPYGPDTLPPAAEQTVPLAAPNPDREEYPDRIEEHTHGHRCRARRVCVQSPTDILFEEFWSEFPHRPGDPKRAARKRFAELLGNGVATPELLIERARAHAINIANTDIAPRYRTHADRWLSEECWVGDSEILSGGSQIMRAVAGIRLKGASDDKKRSNPESVADYWRPILAAYVAKGSMHRDRDWPAGNGLHPEHHASDVPADLLPEFGLSRW